MKLLSKYIPIQTKTDYVLRARNLETIKWLTNNRKGESSVFAVDNNLKIFKWIYYNRKDILYIYDDMVRICMLGKISIINFKGSIFLLNVDIKTRSKYWFIII